jgi:predicted secreted hydrolase
MNNGTLKRVGGFGFACAAIVFSVGCGKNELPSADGGTDAAVPCRLKGTRSCDGEAVLTCPSGYEVRTQCSDKTFCNYGECLFAALTLPYDARPHNDAKSEWWYYTGHLATPSGKPFGFQVTIFQYNVSSASNMGYMCHAAVTDETAKSHEFTEGITLEYVKWRSEPVLLEVLDCRIEIGPGGDHITANIPDSANPGKNLYVIDLVVKGQKRAAMHGNDGIIPMALTGETSYYYSFTRMSADGTLALPDGTVEQVSGLAWMDHQWGDFSVGSFKGWDWWSMQFEDGWEIMLFLFRDKNGMVVEKAGTIIDPKAQATWIEGLDAFDIKALSKWTSPHTGGEYPQNWNITIPTMNWNLIMETGVADQEMVNPAKKYWEGSVVINGRRAGMDVKGVGYVELTGYAKDFFDPKGL